MTNLLASDSEAMFLWELDQARKQVLTMEARGGRPSPALIDTRKKVGFLETFVENHGDANDSVRMKPEVAPNAGQLICDEQEVCPMARGPIMGST